MTICVHSPFGFAQGLSAFILLRPNESGPPRRGLGFHRNDALVDKPFDRPFDKLTVLNGVEALTAPSLPRGQPWHL